jgi:hypothetical protein
MVDRLRLRLGTKLFAGLLVLAAICSATPSAVRAGPLPTPAACDASEFPGLDVLDCSGWYRGDLLGSATVGTGTLLTGLQSLDSSENGFSGSSFFSSSSLRLQRESDIEDLRRLQNLAVIGLTYSDGADKYTALVLVNAGNGLNLEESHFPSEELDRAAIYANNVLPQVLVPMAPPQPLNSPGPLSLLMLGLGVAAVIRRLRPRSRASAQPA